MGRPRPYRKRGLAKLAQKRKDSERKATIMGVDPKKAAPISEDYWDDRVAKYLGLAFREVGMEVYEEWQRRGFTVEPGELEDPSKEERDRAMKLVEGSALRKGSKHR